ncbi:MAG TPA: alpha/beta hydrolase [Abditibacteriaceae bacterium]|jgi:acetyl esterase/lipase
MKPLALFALLSLVAMTAPLHAQNPSTSLEPIRLWATEAPGALGTADKDIPTLTPFLPLPEKATGAAIVVLPGGGYGGLAGHEGKDYALWLNELGITAFVLKYRLGSGGYRHPVMLNDAARAVRLVRARAGEWKLDANRIGIMGSSAGGHLTSTLLTHFDAGNANSDDAIERVSSRPDLGILCYAVISMDTALTHGGSRNNLLGNNPDVELVKLLSNELQVTKETPPTFLWSTADDAAVKVENSLQFALALRKNNVPFELHVYPHGRHGLGLGAPLDKPQDRHPWVTECARWLKEMKFAK